MMTSIKHIVIDARSRQSSTGRYIDRLIDHLQNLDNVNRYTILVSPDDNWLPVSQNFNRVNSKFKQFSVNPIDQFEFAGQLYSLKPDLVHFSMTQQPLLYFGKIVTTTHDLTMLRFTRPGKHSKLFHVFRMSLYKLLFWWSHKKSNQIIVPSEFVKNDLVKLQPFTEKKITVTYESSEPLIKDSIKPLKDVSKPFIMHVGSPFPHKNIDRLIKAFEILSEKYPNLSLVLAGKKELYFKNLEDNLKNSPVREKVIIPGFVSDGQLKWLYKNASCYVLPSLSEGFGLPGLEAMVHETPLVSSNATCLPEIYGNAALFFNPKSVDDMSHKIERVLDDQDFRKDLIARGKIQATKFSWDKMAEQTLNVYKKVLKI